MTQYSKNLFSRYELNFKTSAIALLSALTMVSNAHGADTPWDAVSEQLTESMISALPSSPRQVAVVDNGFATDHPGLKNQLVQGYNGRDDNTNIDASIIMNKGHQAHGKIAPHGTHVAGIIAQMNPHIEIVPVKRGSRNAQRTAKTDAACLKALIGRDDVEVVNLSFGMNWEEMIDPIIKLANEGKTIVVAAGNEKATVRDIVIKSQGKMLSQILRSLNGRVVFVEATEKKDNVQQLAYFSNKPSNTMAEFFISAPGSQIISYVPLDSDKTGMEAQSGTSMAAPVFVGAMMKLATKFNVSVDEARNALFKTAVKGKNLGQGSIDFVAAYNLLKNKDILPQNQVIIPIEEPIQEIKPEPASVENEDLWKAQILPDPLPSIDQLPVEEINEDLLKAQISPDPLPSINQEPTFEINEDIYKARPLPTPTKPTQESEGYLSYGLRLVKNELQTIYKAAEAAVSYVAAPLQSAYQYLSSWF